MRAANYERRVEELPRAVFYNAGDALVHRRGACYDRTLGTATAFDPLRDNRVLKPTELNSMQFAGVFKHTVPLKVGGQWTEINEPGCLQRVELASLSDDFVLGQDNFASCVAGDSSKTDADAENVDQGRFAIYSDVGGYVGRGSARVLQTITVASGDPALTELCDGPETGLVQLLKDYLDAGGALTGVTPTGVTFLRGKDIAADLTLTLAAGTYYGQCKVFDVETSFVTNNFVLTFVGLNLAGAAITTWTADTIDDYVTLEWNGNQWQVQSQLGGILA